MRGFMGALGAIGLGALVGAMVALQIDPNGNGLWVVGALAGGVAAYALYEWEETLYAILFVFKLPFKILYWVPYGIGVFLVGLCRILVTSTFWRDFASGLLFLFSAGTTILVTLVAANQLGVSAAHPLLSWLSIPVVYRTIVAAALGVSLEIALLVAVSPKKTDDGEPMPLFYKGALKGVRWVNPLTVFVYLPFFLLWNIGRVIKLIHSDIRAMCFIYASMGATAGYFIGRGEFGQMLIQTGDTFVTLHSIAPLVGAGIGILLALAGRVFAKTPTTAPIPHD